MEENNLVRLENIRYAKHDFRELKQVFEMLKGIDYAVIKGEPLSMLCYGGYGLRHSGDVDILIDREHVTLLENILSQNGFRTKFIGEDIEVRKNRILCLSSTHQIPPYIKEKDNIITEVDINFDVLWGEYSGKRIPIKDVLKNTICMDVFGVEVKVLNSLYAFIQLLLHHYKDMNSIYLIATSNCIKYSMFEDIYYLLKNNGNEINIKDLMEIAEEYNILPYIYYVLYYTYQVFQEPFLKVYIENLYTQEGEELLEYYGLSKKERRRWGVSFEERLNANQLFKFIEKDLNKEDFIKIKRTKKIFGDI